MCSIFDSSYPVFSLPIDGSVMYSCVCLCDVALENIEIVNKYIIGIIIINLNTLSYIYYQTYIGIAYFL